MGVGVAGSPGLPIIQFYSNFQSSGLSSRKIQKIETRKGEKEPQTYNFIKIIKLVIVFSFGLVSPLSSFF